MNFLEWFKSGLKLKRWLVLTIIGIIGIAMGYSNISKNVNIEVSDVIFNGVIFVLGVVLVVFAYIMSQKQLVQTIAESAVKSNKNINIKKLLFDKGALDKGIKIVVIGGGSGLASVLKGLKEYSDNITAIVSTLGGASPDNQMTNELGILPPNDVRQSIIALSSSEEKMQNLMKYKFKTGILKGQNFANLLLAAMNDICDNNFAKAIQDTSEVLSVTGKVLPVTLDKVQIGAVLKDGSRVVGENSITDKVFERKSAIEKIFLQPPTVEPAPGVIKSIKEADLIVIGPGSLYTGIIPNMLLKEVTDSVKASKALKIFVSNIMTEPGQTDGYAVSDLINAIHDHVGKGIMDYVLASETDIMPEFVRRYNEEGSEILEIDKSEIKSTGVKLAVDNFAMADDKGYIRHDFKKLGAAIMTMAYNNMDLKYHSQAFEAYKIKSKLDKNKKKKKSILFQDTKIITPSKLKGDQNSKEK
jgi:uncharacterized cofD-like protein